MALSLLLAIALQDDVLVLRSEKILVGKITAVDDTGITLQPPGQAPRLLPYAELEPYSAYEARRKRINVDDAAAHVALGDFCRGGKLYRFAIREYQTAADLDAARAAAMDQKVREVSEADADEKLAQADTAKPADAARALRHVLTHYADLPQGAKAKQKLEALTAQVEAQNKKKEEQKKKAQEALKASEEEAPELRERTRLARAMRFGEDAQALWSQGLDHEGAGRLREADRAWRDAVERLNLARDELTAAVESNDVETIQAARTLTPGINQWLVRVYNSLAQLHADGGRLQDARLWVNQTLKLEPENAEAKALKLEITRALLRQKLPE